MDAADVMRAPIVSVRPDTSVPDAIQLMLANRISGLPVVDADGNLVGMISEGDFLRRGETGTERHRPRWIEVLRSGRLAEEYAHSHGRTVGEVMTPRVFTVSEDTPLEAVVEVMERRRIKRVPVMRAGRPVGIVSRADLLRALARLSVEVPTAATDDPAIRDGLNAELARLSWVPRTVRFGVRHGVVEFSGVIFDENDRAGRRVAAENVAGVTAVQDRMVLVEPLSGLPIMGVDQPVE